jgi:UDP-2-acetamido-3-amino-2,3-dideoxy-glucuronate N-acetyltransferase
MLKDVYVHASAIVDEPCEIGPGTKIWHFCHVMKGARIGAGCVLGQNVYVGSRAVLGDGVKVQNNVSIYDDVVLEEGVFCGPSAVFTNVLNPRAFVERKTEYQKTLVERGASIGANATVVCGTTLGAYCLVAAGAVVTRDIPPHALVKGAPARRTGWVCRCGDKLPAAAPARCQRCGLAYLIEADRCTLIT